jgi:glycosyltransferase involved in cell wall biosynthesis
MTNVFRADVSIIIPSYNCVRYLPDAIKSCREQDFDGLIEAVVVDDGSTDDTVALLHGLRSKYENPRFRLKISRQSNRGSSAARNNGLRRSSSDKILFLDADDAYAHQMVDKCLNALIAHPNAGLVYTDVVGCDKTLNKVREIRKPDFDLAELLSAFYTGCRAFHRRVLETVGGFNQDFRYAEDYDLALTIATCQAFEPFIHIPELLYLYRSNPNGLTATAGEAIWTASRAVVQNAFDRLGIKTTIPPASRDRHGKKRFLDPETIRQLITGS